jgi:hypothetical protein
VLGLALGGWQLSGVLRLASETPFTVIDTGVDIDFDGFAESRPVIVDRSILNTSLDDPGISMQQLPRSAFRSVAFGDTIADIVPRAILFSLTGLTGWTWRWRRSSRCRGPDTACQYAWRASNVLNHVQFGFPSNNLSAANFGAIVGTAAAYSPRTLQLVIRYRY